MLAFGTIVSPENEVINDRKSLRTEPLIKLSFWTRETTAMLDSLQLGSVSVGAVSRRLARIAFASFVYLLHADAFPS